jgi:ribosomal protein L11 methyltransferase
MDYTEVLVSIKPYSQQNAEIITALLADIGFESFVEGEDSLAAYIPTIDTQNLDLETFSKNLPIDAEVTFKVKNIKDENWNKQWESNFKPVTVLDYCRIRAPFHSYESGYQLEVVMQPKMAFGTGHHQTTWLMIWQLFNLNIKGKSVLDMGCGTGVLAIIAEKLGATDVTAIDIDEWAYANTCENIAANSCSKIEVEQNDANGLMGKKFDIILANINRNILLNDLPTYAKHLNPSGILVMSGILKQDTDLIIQKSEELGLQVASTQYKDEWASIVTIKS